MSQKASSRISVELTFVNNKKLFEKYLWRNN